MLRSDIINELASLFEAPSYLEVGVWRGDTFNAVKVNKKVAVDPKFDLNLPEGNSFQGADYFEMTSDDYFKSHSSDRTKFDIIFLDGLHTFEQTLVDLLHAIDRCKENGLIVIDDVMPDSYPASMRSEAECYTFRQKLGDPSTHWMGDVYKLAFFIDAYMLNWTFATVAETHGQLVIWRGTRASSTASKELLAEICAKAYVDTVLQRNIFNIRPLAEIIAAASLSHRLDEPSLKSDACPEPAPAPVSRQTSSALTKISYYFEPLAGLAHADDIPDLISLHTRSFEQHGWEVVPLDEQTSRRHPLYNLFDDESSFFNQSRNGWAYTRACYMRWLAYAVVGHPFADFDIINYGFTPDDASEMRASAAQPIMLSGAGAVGLLEGEEYSQIFDAFIKYKNAPFVSGMLEIDVNDMNILLECGRDLFSLIGNDDVRIARDYTCPGWDIAKLVHYPYHYTPMPRAEKVKVVRPLVEVRYSV